MSQVVTMMLSSCHNFTLTISERRTVVACDCDNFHAEQEGDDPRSMIEAARDHLGKSLVLPDQIPTVREVVAP